MNRAAKIVCTLGPAVGSDEQVLALVEAGMDVARLNFSHGSYEDHAANYRRVRQASDLTGHAVAVLADLQGPKIRLGSFAGGPVLWSPGETVIVTTEQVPGTHDRVSTTYQGLPGDVQLGDMVLVDDGKVSLTVVKVDDRDVYLEVRDGGVVSDHKGINLPGVNVSEPALTPKDEADLRFALALRVDLVALSFVRSADDADDVHRVMAEEGAILPVLAKLEKPQAVERLDEVVAAFDGIMVARGDLGVEMPLEDVPLVQKRAVQACRDQAKPVIVATQMLDSMIANARPTRAEASDVANAVLDGADALMLSGETSVGAHPIDTVRTMARIISAAERGTSPQHVSSLSRPPRTQSGAVARAAIDVAYSLNAHAIAAFTMGGDTVRRLARHHADFPLFAFTPVQATRSQLALSWGIETFFTETVTTLGDMVLQVDELLIGAGRAKIGDVVIMVAGVPLSTPGATNTIRVHRVGSIPANG